MKLFSKLFCASAIFCFASFVNAQTQATSSDQSTLSQCDGSTCYTLVSDDNTATDQDQSDDATSQDSDQQDADNDDDSSDDPNDEDDPDDIE